MGSAKGHPGCLRFWLGYLDTRALTGSTTDPSRLLGNHWTYFEQQGLADFKILGLKPPPLPSFRCGAGVIAEALSVALRTQDAVRHKAVQLSGWNPLGTEGLCSATFFYQGSLSMKKVLVVSLAIFAVSTSGALAKKSAKPKAPAAATTANPGSAGPPMIGQVSDADRALYQKSQRESGMKK